MRRFSRVGVGCAMDGPGDTGEPVIGSVRPSTQVATNGRCGASTGCHEGGPLSTRVGHGQTPRDAIESRRPRWRSDRHPTVVITFRTEPARITRAPTERRRSGSAATAPQCGARQTNSRVLAPHGCGWCVSHLGSTGAAHESRGSMSSAVVLQVGIHRPHLRMAVVFTPRVRRRQLGRLLDNCSP